ncbi:MAG: 6-carboxytetrahydropterin synthase [Bacteroidota bacterium]|nr:6-carboxytetrahydropterin synthase [Bacteroidota bacterium]
MTVVTRRETFCAAHRLFNPAWTDAMNEEVYGACSRASWHGHNYELEVSVEGDIDPETGFLVNLKLLRDIIREEVVSKLDHRNLNTDVDFLAGVVPTAENIAMAVWRRLENKIPSGRLCCIRLRETENNVVEYRG